MEPNALRDGAVFEVTSDGVLHLLLEFAQVATLSRNSSTAWSIPGGDQYAGVVSFDLEYDFFHLSWSSSDVRTFR